jgi:hypothetical protein
MFYDPDLEKFFQCQLTRVAEMPAIAQTAAVSHVAGKRKPSLSQQEAMPSVSIYLSRYLNHPKR